MVDGCGSLSERCLRVEHLHECAQRKFPVKMQKNGCNRKHCVYDFTFHTGLGSRAVTHEGCVAELDSQGNALDRELSWSDVVPEWQHGDDWLCSASWAEQ